MYPKPIQNLITLLSTLPGIGPRQATRFAFFLLKQPGAWLDELQIALKELKTIRNCSQCFRTIEQNGANASLCFLCTNPKRDHTVIVVIEKESDMHNLEQTRAFNGLYHILDGTISPLDPDSPKRLHLRALYERVKKLLEETRQKEEGNIEVILATSSTTEGDTTALYIDRVLAPLQKEFPYLTITRLGRGLSLGAELEYADEITLKNALINRR